MVDASASAQPCATEHESSPAATIEKRLAPCVELTKAGADRIAELIEDALDDDAFDRADSILYLIRRSDDAVLWDEGVFVTALLRTAAVGLTACDMRKDTAMALRPATVALLEELASALDAFHLGNGLDRLKGFSQWIPTATGVQDQAVTHSVKPGHVALHGDEQSVSIVLDAVYGVINIATSLADLVHRPSPTVEVSPLYTQIRANAAYLEKLGLVLCDAVDSHEQPFASAYKDVWVASTPTGSAA